MTGMNVKMDLIKLDMVVKDIHRIWSEVPSQYLRPKSILAQSRALVRSDVRKALNLAEKSRKLFQEESALATMYNTVADRVQFAGDTARRLDGEYSRNLADGEYGKAKTTLDRLMTLVGHAEDNSSLLCITALSSDDRGASLSFTNNGQYLMAVTELSVTKGSERVPTDPRKTFTIHAGASRDVVVSACPPFDVIVEFTENGENRSLRWGWE